VHHACEQIGGGPESEGVAGEGQQSRWAQVNIKDTIEFKLSRCMDGQELRRTTPEGILL
jgi:hypothetical protein